MQVQQPIDILSGGGRSAEPASRSKSSVSEDADKQASAPFKDEVQKQIDHAKAQPKHDKTEDNQTDTDVSANDDAMNDSPRTTAESETDTEQNPPLVAEEAESAESEEQTEEAINAFASQLDASILSTGKEAPVPAILTAGLPQGGNRLPVSTADAEALSLQQSNHTNRTAMEQSQLQAALRQSSNAADSIKAESVKNAAVTVTGAEPLVVDAKLFKPGSTLDRQFISNAQFADMMSEQQVSELQGAEMLAKASRLQQVPLSTAIASSVQASPNMQAAPSAPVSDSAATFNLNSPLAQSLSATIGAPLQSAGWSQQMTDQVNVMLKGGFQQAEIKLNPAHLGPMEIKLSVNDDKTSIHFVAHHAPVRDAIDAAMPRLRDMLEQQGLNLADVDVSSQSEQQQADSETAQHAGGTGGVDVATTADDENLNTAVTSSVTMSVDSGINLYA